MGAEQIAQRKHCLWYRRSRKAMQFFDSQSFIPRSSFGASYVRVSMRTANTGGRRHCPHFVHIRWSMWKLSRPIEMPGVLRQM